MTTVLNQSAAAQDLMRDFAELTGLDPTSSHPRRYLWTDAFAVCNYLGFFEATGNAAFRDLALHLVRQVHGTLGRHRDDDTRGGWISGLLSKEGEMHPTAGGLRIGKMLPERSLAEEDDDREWDRDGQYYHYLTKWMHALNRVSRVTGNQDCFSWAVELACTAHARFTYFPPGGRTKRMYWKMSVDLTRPLVLSMGQHDPLDGFVTYNELQLAASRRTGFSREQVLTSEIADMDGICRGMDMATDDPLGIGGLLCDALRITLLGARGGPVYPGLLETVLGSALTGLTSFERSGLLAAPARYRLAFRELGLSIGLAAVEMLPDHIRENSEGFAGRESLQHKVQAIRDYMPLREEIEGFWLEEKNRKAGSWRDHREINLVMLATSLAPAGFLGF